MTHTKRDKGEDRRQQALRDIERAGEQSETLGSSALGRMSDRLRSHFAGGDGEEDDAIEIWGQRIGRTLGLIFCLILVYYLAVTYL